MWRHEQHCESLFDMARKSSRPRSSFSAAPSGTVRPSTLVSRLFFIAGLGGVFVSILGFVWFGDKVASLKTPSNVPNADGAASLTGGSDARLKLGVQLVESRKVPRLLISGVNRVATAQEVRLVAGGAASTYMCCIDLGREATDTVGNAQEVSTWVARHNVKKLILITDNYHMPRSLFEVQRANPNLTIIPYPVQADLYSDKDWWKNERTLRGLGLEYGKFLVAVSRAYVLGFGQSKTS
jgi:uncharacterized SAM-binding protein YcdF (DUF218 family)